MEYIFRTIKSLTPYYTLDKLKTISTSKDIYKEMGEPILFNENQVWIFAFHKKQLAGFVCYENDLINYIYTFPEFRNKGLFNILYNELPYQNWKTIASNMSLNLFIKKGFKVIKNYKNCHKLELKIK